MYNTGLKIPALALIAGFIVHNADHARRGVDAITEAVLWGGFFGLAVGAVAITLVLSDHTTAAAAAALGGLSLAVGVSAVHLLPDWGPLSDSLPSGDVDAVTWVAVLAEIGGAAWLGLAGLRRLRSNDWQVAPAAINPAPRS